MISAVVLSLCQTHTHTHTHTHRQYISSDQSPFLSLEKPSIISTGDFHLYQGNILIFYFYSNTTFRYLLQHRWGGSVTLNFSAHNFRSFSSLSAQRPLCFCVVVNCCFLGFTLMGSFSRKCIFIWSSYSSPVYGFGTTLKWFSVNF